jgi:hypothetical protein
MSLILGKSHLSLLALPTFVRKHISDRRENPHLTTTTHDKLSGPLEHKLKRTGIAEQVEGKRKGVETP